MKLTETASGLLFSQEPFPSWVGWIALIFLLLLIPTIKSFISSYKEYDGIKRIAVCFYYIGWIGFLLLFASVLYPSSQYDKHYEVEVNYKDSNQFVSIISGENKIEYKNPLNWYNGILIEDNTETGSDSEKKGSYKLYLIRKDGLLISLHSYSAKNWNNILPKIKKLGLPIVNDPLSLVTHSKENIQTIGMESLCQSIKSGQCDQSNESIEMQWELHVHPFFFKIGLGLVSITWLFIIFRTLAKSNQLKEYAFMYFVVIIFSGAFVYYFLNTFHAKQRITFSEKEYQSYTDSPFLGKSQYYEGSWNAIQSTSIAIGPEENGGIMIFEDKINTTDVFSLLKNQFESAINGKTKYIRLESIPIYDQLKVADYVLSKSSSSW